jgi:hypothetical protein
MCYQDKCRFNKNHEVGSIHQEQSRRRPLLFDVKFVLAGQVLHLVVVNELQGLRGGARCVCVWGGGGGIECGTSCCTILGQQTLCQETPA